MKQRSIKKIDKNKGFLMTTPKKEGKGKGCNISLAMIVFLGWRNLKVNKTRSVLTVGGVALGIGIISFLLCMGFGIQRMIIEEVTKNNPRNILDINNGNLDSFVSLNDEFIEKIAGIEGVERIERQVNTGGKVFIADSQTDAVIYGANSGYLELARIKYSQNETEYVDDQANIIISSKLAALLGFERPAEIIGEKIKFDAVVSKEISSGMQEETTKTENEATIVGFVQDNASFFYIPFDYLKDNLGIDFAQSGKVLVNDVESFGMIEGQIEQIGFLTESVNEIIEDINSFFVILRVALIVLGTIIMAISAMGMLNTLSISLLQRTKEVGILKALGAKRKDIFRMFIFEAIIISFFGGFLGLASGFGFSIFINKVLIYFAQKNEVELSTFVYMPYFFILAISLFILFLGLVTGIMPAFRAAKIHALDALRYE
ncbi:ABC transporter permease [bacterium]|jgi:putative ABC transport system permease protein|nr:ABC transporter permease [bacterium]MBT4250986.1 ABC transporter permease [bacterium]MBT4597826.1 ABC transporter permease [bacterium]MBT6753982.1 ABC transporter permease [bacterium]MBT7037411.1 ABC transporter permease [bacterium]